MIELILGGARSGKSRYAERQAAASNKDVYYIATASAGDGEMSQRIKQHVQQRPAHWQTIEEPVQLASVLQQHDQANRLFLVDCLTLWLSNILFSDSEQANEQRFEDEKKQLLELLPQLNADIILVSNEVGQGITPINAMARRFVDEAGRLHQDISPLSHKVSFVTAGLVQQLK
ncbi:MAG: bifunctional adenosylcobinamide kinase/adenosylcobinamide-phosphate guanylyltransferase [Cycloclasticus sp.]|jgi:adenosylcobinamide kinase (EC 2.7.1.156)